MTSKTALDILKTGRNCLITGAAGSGKTYLLNQYIDYLKKHNVPTAVTASTGIAATHLGGQTIHSWSGLGVRQTLSPYDLEYMEEKSYLWKRLDAVKVLIIDEVSMLHHWQLDMVDQVLRHFKRNSEPFGGIQVVLCGDFFQLPPIAGSAGLAQFAYRSEVWQQAGFKVCYLTSQYRQDDDVLLSILSAIRAGQVTVETKSLLQSRCGVEVSEPTPTRLFTHNIDVDELNHRELAKLSGAPSAYQMKTKGNKVLVEQLVKSCLAPAELRLKVGAKVMFVKNNFEAGYVNGSLGEVVSLKKEFPEVKLSDGRVIEVEPMTWSIEEDGKVKAEIAQVPLRLAWAITVHKSQGMSLEAVEADLSKAFEAGMGYVALSRVRRLSGLALVGFNDTALAINKEAFLADRRLQELSAELHESCHSEDLSSLANEFIKASGQPAKPKKVSTYEQTKELVLQKMPIKQMAEKRGVTVETILTHLEKLSDSDRDLDLSYLKRSYQPTKLAKVHQVMDKLSEKERGLLSAIKRRVPSSISFNDIRLARLFYNR